MAMTARQTLTLTRTARNTYVLPGSAQPAVLTLSSWRSKADATIAGTPYELTMSGLLDRAATARRPGHDEPIMRIGRKSCVLPSGHSAVWKVKRGWHGYNATLRADGLGEISLHLGRRARSDIVAEVAAEWPERDLVVLTAAFALLIRRRDDSRSSDAGAATVAGAATS